MVLVGALASIMLTVLLPFLTGIVPVSTVPQLMSDTFSKQSAVIHPDPDPVY